MKIGTKLLKWWLIFCLTILGFGASYHFNVHSLLYNADITKLSFLIIVIFVFTSGTTFENIDVSNTQTLQDALASMARGMSTALYTTLTGLIASLIIKIQLVNYEVSELAD